MDFAHGRRTRRPTTHQELHSQPLRLRPVRRRNAWGCALSLSSAFRVVPPSFDRWMSDVPYISALIVSSFAYFACLCKLDERASQCTYLLLITSAQNAEAVICFSSLRSPLTGRRKAVPVKRNRLYSLNATTGLTTYATYLLKRVLTCPVCGLICHA